MNAGVGYPVRRQDVWRQETAGTVRGLRLDGSLVVDRKPREIVQVIRQDTAAVDKRSVSDFKLFEVACRHMPKANRHLVINPESWWSTVEVNSSNFGHLAAGETFLVVAGRDDHSPRGLGVSKLTQD
jgi:hypothetical protein